MELTPELVELLIARLVPPDDREVVANLLAVYGRQPYEREPVRVRVALLKLSEGNVDRLRTLLADAQRDYRDVLAWAEYPAEMAGPVTGVSSAEQTRIRQADRGQYLAWLAKHTGQSRP